MAFVSQKSNSIPRSAIREMFALQTGMDDVISFALGEPDFTAPRHIIDATIRSFDRGETHYVPNNGIPALREEVAKSYQNRGLDYNADEIMIGAGAISLLMLTVTAVLDLGDELILPDPGWANYKGLAMQAGASAVPVKVYEENGFMYDPDDLRDAITDKTKVILINSPSNPTGGVASKENLKQIADLAKEQDLYIISDEIYRQLLWSDEEYVSIASFPGMKERTVIIDGFSKAYAMTGFRVGFAAAPAEVTAAMIKLVENVLSSVNEGVQWGGVAALTGSQGCVAEMKNEYRKRREIMLNGLNSIPGISCLPPKGAFYAFPNIKKLGLSSRDFAIRLLKEQRTVVVPGNGFGEGGEGFIRLSYATSEENIREGLKRMGAFIDSLT